jgi:fumarate hydratase class I
VGGTSAELTLKAVKLAWAGALDHLPTKGSPTGHAFRDLELESRVLEASRELGMEAVFMITVKDFPTLIIIDDKGHDFFDRF